MMRGNNALCISASRKATAKGHPHPLLHEKYRMRGNLLLLFLSSSSDMVALIDDDCGGATPSDLASDLRK